MKLANKRVVCLGDIHGRDVWKKIVNDPKNKDSIIIFLGDYFDSFHIDINAQINNYLDIMAFKRANRNRVFCLLGNHDHHYLPYIDNTCSGFRSDTKLRISHILDQNIKDGLHLMAMEVNNGGKRFLFSHAGVSELWTENNDISWLHPVSGINELFLTKPRKFNFTSNNVLDYYGNAPSQPPTWIRPKTLNKVRLKDFIHVVGHTSQGQKIVHKHYKHIILCDALPKEYLVIEADAELKPIKIKK